MKKETLDKFVEAIDSLEEEIGDIHGLEIDLNHPIKDGKKQSFAEIKSFRIKYETIAELDT